MIVGIPKEIKDSENRVGIVPAGVKMLTSAGHRVLIEAGAGLGSGIRDEDFSAVGASIVATAEVYAQADMIIKVKEPLASEYALYRPGQILFTYLHMAAEPKLCDALLQRKVIGIGYETVQLSNGALPLLMPMSEVAGKMSVQIGAHYLESHCQGSGVLLGGVPGVEPGHAVVVGGGVVGTNAAKTAAGLGAQVTILENNPARLRYLDDLFGNQVITRMSNEFNIADAVRKADLVIGAVLIPGGKAPQLVSEEMVKKMRPGSVIVDVAIDQGGSIATVDRVTAHSDPVFIKHGVLHYSVPNIPGAVARTSTFALTNATMPYALMLANLGWAEAARQDEAIRKGINVANGLVTHAAVAQALDRAHTDVETLL